MRLLTILTIALGMTSVGFACDFQFERVVLHSEQGQSFKTVRTITDRNGRDHTIYNVAIALNADVKEKLLSLSEKGTNVCAYGSFSPISPRQYFIYDVR